MRARCITFTHPQRTGPNTMDRKDNLDVTDDHFCMGVIGEPSFRRGIIEVDVNRRYVVIRNPKIDRTTGEPLQVIVPMERVVGWEPLTSAGWTQYYPEEKPPKADQAA